MATRLYCGQARKCAKAHTIRKVEGRATEDNVLQGLSNPQDQAGNRKVDANADEGVSAINGYGFTHLGAWLARRHASYTRFMKRVQRMIASVTAAEKETGNIAHEVEKRKATAG